MGGSSAHSVNGEDSSPLTGLWRGISGVVGRGYTVNRRCYHQFLPIASCLPKLRQKKEPCQHDNARQEVQRDSSGVVWYRRGSGNRLIFQGQKTLPVSSVTAKIQIQFQYAKFGINLSVEGKLSHSQNPMKFFTIISSQTIFNCVWK